MRLTTISVRSWARRMPQLSATIKSFSLIVVQVRQIILLINIIGLSLWIWDLWIWEVVDMEWLAISTTMFSQQPLN